MWLNLLLLFWLSLTPFATEYMGETHAAPLSVALYGTVQSLCAFAYRFLATEIMKHHRDNVPAAIQRKNSLKNSLATLCSVLSVPLAFVSVWLSLSLLVMPALMYFVPERAIEQM